MEGTKTTVRPATWNRPAAAGLIVKCALRAAALTPAWLKVISMPVVSGTPVASLPGIVSMTTSGLAVWAAQAVSTLPSARVSEMR